MQMHGWAVFNKGHWDTIAAVSAFKLGLVWGETAPEIPMGLCMRRGLQWMGALMAPELQHFAVGE